MNAVAAGLGAHVDDRIPDAARRSQEDRVLAEDAEGERIDERVRTEARVERSLAANRGHPEAVAVVRDTLHDAAHDPAIRRPVLRIVRRAEPQRVHAGDRPRPHREDVAQDASDAGGGTLERLDVAGMVVRLDLEGRGPAAADIDDAGVLAGTDQNALSLRREFLQEQARALVGAVLAPHHADNAEFGNRGRPSQPVENPLVLLRGQAVLDSQPLVRLRLHGLSRPPPQRQSSTGRWPCRRSNPWRGRRPVRGAASCRARCAAR